MSAPSTTRWRETERMVARWLQENGWPDSQTTRAVNRGVQSLSGDIAYGPCTIEVKSHTSGTSWPSWRKQAEVEAEGGPWIVVWRRPRETDVGLWPAWWGNRLGGGFGVFALAVEMAP